MSHTVRLVPGRVAHPFHSATLNDPNLGCPTLPCSLRRVGGDQANRKTPKLQPRRRFRTAYSTFDPTPETSASAYIASI
jgi:hypothetical protein